MKKILNDPTKYVDEMLEGLVHANPDTLCLLGANGRVVARTLDAQAQEKVGLVSGGGSGHLPLFTGYVGEGLLDSCAIGDVFSSPNVSQMLDAIRAANRGAGVLALYGNYSGDVMNFEMATELAQQQGISVRSVVMTDDVASATPAEVEKRRGVAGLVYLYKIVGAASRKGADLDETARVAEKVVQSTRSMGIALTPCVVPSVGHPTFTIAETAMEIGMGIHGEPGVRTADLASADSIAQELLDAVTAELDPSEGARVSVMVNSLGATPHEELLIIYRYLQRVLSKRGITTTFPLIGRFATSMEMMGLSITILKLDDELEEYLLAPCVSPFWRVG